MSVKKILTEPNKLLRQISKNVDRVGDEERALMADRWYTQRWSEAEQLHLWEFDEGETISGNANILSEWVGDLIQARSLQQGNKS